MTSSGRGRGKPAGNPPPAGGEPTAAAAGPIAAELAAAIAVREIAEALASIEILARMILGARGPVLIGLTAAEPLGILERAAAGPPDG